MLIVHTGEGKGKTTAAMGIALRGWAQSWNVGVYQFVKSGKWRTGEEAAFRALDDAHRRDGVGGPVTWEHLGRGWTWSRPHADQPLEAEELARIGWEHVRAQLAAERHDLLILDEFTYPMARGWVQTDDVLAHLRNRPGSQHVVITGRGAPEKLVAAADLVTDMTKVKHPFDGGQRGQAGIEW
ncbi:cob(I)yrinic acid a,c-diamide adenosyltransferase [Tessaracoccus massiliensis]|uniref:cob(I)yrinic acid a,c-diamide adenosyltransferase n=1 Tax=Tessaracoccus massiliensis TaxID=1522311 RepID=UPI001FE8B1C7|nr:cob(I)yrinic acid a,c-diamide adenosyltransferase [Tessaracoccus massiliensis]